MCPGSYSIVNRSRRRKLPHSRAKKTLSIKQRKFIDGKLRGRSSSDAAREWNLVLAKWFVGDRVPGRGLLYARLTQLRWYAQDNCVVIVITEPHLKRLLKGADLSFGRLLLQGYESVRFGLPDGTDHSSS